MAKKQSLKERLDALPAAEKKKQIELIMKDFSVSRTTIYRWARDAKSKKPKLLNQYPKK